jgi:hypothetical protein
MERGSDGQTGWIVLSASDGATPRLSSDVAACAQENVSLQSISIISAFGFGMHAF